MIVRPSHNWFRMLFVWNGSVLQSIIPQLAVLTLVGLLAVIAHRYNFGPMIPLSRSSSPAISRPGKGMIWTASWPS